MTFPTFLLVLLTLAAAALIVRELTLRLLSPNLFGGRRALEQTLHVLGHDRVERRHRSRPRFFRWDRRAEAKRSSRLTFWLQMIDGALFVGLLFAENVLDAPLWLRLQTLAISALFVGTQLALFLTGFTLIIRIERDAPPQPTGRLAPSETPEEGRS